MKYGIIYSMDNENIVKEVQELKKLNKENFELLQHNNRILRRIQKKMRTQTAVRILYWAVLIGSTLGMYYYLQPVFDTISNQYDGLISLPDKILPTNVLDF